MLRKVESLRLFSSLTLGAVNNILPNPFLHQFFSSGCFLDSTFLKKKKNYGVPMMAWNL
ncbi:hypothetical protein SLEP1_g45882 [Rubroshorea leprosula]|uniref:Uncharacterized protein n=1 Tax=Rubroshorea leprosula TaxID=152421 RepID=A0AAV5LLA0_9ROSI|nr:hypothetical protein SLEP1_g45882 [Rubroshorea leprosula]